MIHHLKYCLLALALVAFVPTAGHAEAETTEKRTFLTSIFGTKEERQARREERQEKRALARIQPASLDAEDAKYRVKSAVYLATKTRPKGRLWCVPFARQVSGINLRGNAKTWWAQAEGLYERGKTPEIGAVMSFSSSPAMPRGHVAVVSDILSDREILIDHANWERNVISTGALVVDVSEKGDWSKVRVANSNGTLGRINPVNGFIFNQAQF